MPLSPIDVTQQEFRVSLRGYDEGEVDSFLDEVVDSMKDYDQRLRDADERVAILEEQLQANRETEDAMRRAFVAAQRTADEIVAEAQSEGERIVAEAGAQAAMVSADQVREREQLQTDVLTLREVVKDVKARLAELSKGVLPAFEELHDELEASSVGGSSKGSLSERVAQLSAHEEVGETIPAFAATDDLPATSPDLSPFAEAEPEELAMEPIDIDLEEAITDGGAPTEEVPTFGSHRARETSISDEDEAYQPKGGGWLTSPNEPLPGRSGPATGDLTTGEVPSVSEGWLPSDGPTEQSDWASEQTAEASEPDAPDVEETKTRRRPWERES